MAGCVYYSTQIKISSDMFSMLSTLIGVALKHVPSGLTVLDPNRCDF